MEYIDINKGNINIKTRKNDTSLKKWWALIKVRYVWLCWSDIHKIRDMHFKQKNILWHEIVWLVIKSQNTDIQGKYIVIDPLLPCHTCEYCLKDKSQLCKKISAIGRDIDGWFAEYVKVPESNIHLLPQKDDKMLYVLTDSIACVIHGLHMIDRKNIKKVAIVGDWTLWTISKMLCSKLFWDAIMYNKKDISMINKKDQEQYDLVIEAVGQNQADTINTAIQIVKRWWAILTFGVFPEDFNKIINIRELLYKEIRLVGSNSFGIYKKASEFVDAIKYIHTNKGSVEKLITHKYKMTNVTIENILWKNEKRIKTIFYTE